MSSSTQPIVYRADSRDRRNTASVSRLQDLVEGLGGCSPPERLAGPGVEGQGDGRAVVLAVQAQVGALREVRAQKPVGGLVRAALPWAVGVAEVDLQTSVDPQPRMLGHLCPLIPG